MILRNTNTYLKSEFYLITQLYYLLVCTSEICKSEKPTRYHGDLWNVTECEFCTCKHGKVQCFNAVCEPAICSEVFSTCKNLTTHLYKYIVLLYLQTSIKCMTHHDLIIYHVCLKLVSHSYFAKSVC